MTAAAAESTVTPNGLYDNLRRLINVVDELR